MSRSRAKKKQRRRARAETGGGALAASAQERAAARTQTGAPQTPKTPPPAPAPAPAPAPQRRPSRLDVRAGIPRPDAIWAPFPLTEIGMAVGLSLFALGFVASVPALFVAGIGVLAVVVAELCLREHFSGFRSHSILLGLLPVSAVHLGIVYAGVATWRGPVALAIDLAVAGTLAWWLQRRFVAVQGYARVAGHRSAG